MNALLRKDLLAGLAALALGAAVVWISLDYRLGTPARMGPGMFPLALGVVLSLSGLGAALFALRSVEPAPALRVRAMLAVTGALVLFALTVERLGFIPASVILIFVSGLAETPVQWRALALLSVILAPAAYALFVVFLGIPAPAFAWGAP
ncbi:tripartite tricarboxylate transporter TctB family protein [Rubrimonas cliftonensis]|nr:tripartite tricarboxylate transporter TctB family protein [Rubrimonas cliftonensis]